MSLANITGSEVEDFIHFPADYIHPSRAREWLPDLPESIAVKIAANPRLRSKASNIIAPAYGLEDCSETLDEIDSHTVTMSLQALTTLAGIAGSIWHAPALRRAVDRTSAF